MDDKTIVIEIPWKTIDSTDEPALAEFVLKHMQGQLLQ
jgi:hypothetical protein